MLKFSLTSATCVALILGAALAPFAFAGGGGGGGPVGVGFGITDNSGAGLVNIVNPERDGVFGNLVFTLFGGPNDTLVVGDWNGDGTKTLGVTQELNGALVWVRDFTGNGVLEFDLFGSAGDIPAVGDWDPNSAGDEMGVTRADVGAGTLTWILADNTPGTGFSITQFGVATDVPAPGNWDSNAGNGDELGLTRDAGGAALLWITEGSGGLDYNLFGAVGDTPVQGDYTGDGNTNFGVSTPGSNLFILDGPTLEFHLLGSGTEDPFRSETFGQGP